MDYIYPNSKILIFAREPVPGKVKTRLQAELGIEKTYQLHCALIAYQVEQAFRSGLAPIELWVSSNPSHNVFQKLAAFTAIFEQQGDDLGQRMLNAAESTLRHSDSVVIVGADCPSVDKDYLSQSLQILQQGSEIVLGPAEDGGYVLVGLRHAWRDMFDNMPWGTELVLTKTLARLEAAGVPFSLLDPRWDLDRPEDLVRLTELRPPLPFNHSV